MTPMGIDSQFDTATPQISNLDRCHRCGRPRAAHGIDWTCSSGRPVGGRPFVTLVIVAGLLTIAGLGALTASSATATSLGTLAAAGLLAGLTLLVCAAVIAGRRR
jgi:hypothetical protein